MATFTAPMALLLQRWAVRPPVVRGGVPEERQTDAEQTAVVVGLGSGLADQFVEALLALGRDPVHDLSAPSRERRRVRGQQGLRLGLVGGDVARGEQSLERRVEGAERDGPQTPED